MPFALKLQLSPAGHDQVHIIPKTALSLFFQHASQGMQCLMLDGSPTVSRRSTSANPTTTNLQGQREILFALKAVDGQKDMFGISGHQLICLWTLDVLQGKREGNS